MALSQTKVYETKRQNRRPSSECHVPTTPSMLSIYIKVTKAAHLQTPTDTFRNNIRTVQIGDYKRSMGAGDAGDANDTIEQNGSDCK